MALEEKRREVWQRVVHFARTNGVAGPLLLEHALDFEHPRLREGMYALTVGEEFSSDFIEVGLDEWRSTAVAKICRQRCAACAPASRWRGARPGCEPPSWPGSSRR